MKVSFKVASVDALGAEVHIFSGGGSVAETFRIPSDRDHLCCFKTLAVEDTYSLGKYSI